MHILRKSPLESFHSLYGSCRESQSSLYDLRDSSSESEKRRGVEQGKSVRGRQAGAAGGPAPRAPSAMPCSLGKGFQVGAVGTQAHQAHGMHRTVPSALSRCPTKDMSLVSLHCGFSPLTAEAWEIPDDPLPAARICFGMHSHLELLHADSVELARLHDNRVEEAARHEERGRQQRIQQMQMQHLVSLQQQQPQLPLPARTQESATPASDSIKLQQGEQCALNAELDLHPDLKQSLAQFLRSYDQLIAASVQPQEGSQRPAKRPRGVHMPSGV